MSEETASNAGSGTDSTAPAAQSEVPTLESVYAEFNIEGEQKPPAKSEAPASAPATTPAAPPKLPDPVSDPDGFSAWQVQQLQSQNALQKQVQDAMHTIRSQEEMAQAAANERELSAIVDQVHKQLDGVPHKIVKYALADRYDTDARFRAIIDGRKANPAALNKALAAVAPEIARDLNVRADPQIAENQRALNEATASMTSRAPDADARAAQAKMLEMSGGEFDHSWNRILRGS